MKILHLLFVLFWVVLPVPAQVPDTLFLWPHEVPGSSFAKHRPIQTADTSRGVIRITNVTNPALLVFRPNEAQRNGAAVIVAPGGGYQYLAVNIEGHEIAAWLNRLGYTAFVLEYRVPQQQQEALWDMQRAIRLVRNTSEKLGIDSSKIGIMGFSAGAHLCARAGILFAQPTLTYEPDLTTISARPDFVLLIYPAYLTQSNTLTLSPEISNGMNLPPFFAFATTDDPYAGMGTLIFAQHLITKGGNIELHLMPKGGHGYGLRAGNVAAETWPTLAEQWLNHTLFNQ